jgi:peptidoglycan-associated lipoprotein
MNHATCLSVVALSLFAAAACGAQGNKPNAAATLPPSSETGSQLPAAHDGLFVRNDNLKIAYFESGQSLLSDKAKAELKSNVDWLKQNLPLQIVVAGYSDGRGTPEQNLAVGQRRAATLRDYYVAMGIPRSRISTTSLGQEEPVCFEPTEECAWKNRRVETLIENKSLAAR